MNKSILKKALVLIVTIICIILAIYIIPKIYNIFSKIISTGFDKPVNIENNLDFTGMATLSGDNILNTGSNSLNLENPFIHDLDKNYKKTIYFLPKQPTEIPAGYTYNQRSQVIIDYMTKNTIHLKQIKTNQAYMYLKLSKLPISPIFIYRYGSNLGGYKRSGNLNLGSFVEKISDTEYVFDMTKIQYSNFGNGDKMTYNWLNDINEGRSLYLALAYKGFDGNYIEQVIIFEK